MRRDWYSGAGKYTAGIDPLVFLNWGVVRAAFDTGAASVTVPAGPIATALSAWLAQLAPHSRWNGWEKGYDGTWSRCDSEPALLAPASPPIPAPVLLTADDPRWRDGAKVRGEWPDGSVCEGWLQSLTILPGKWFIKHGGCGGSVDVDHVLVYLITEVPDPDADVRDVLHDAFAAPSIAELDDDELDHVLRNVRAAGYDIVKRAS